MRLVWGIDTAVADFVGAHFPLVARHGWNGVFAGIGIADADGVLVGGFVVSDWRGHDACVSIYADTPRFLTPRIIRELCAWAFIDQGFRRLTAEIAKKNRRARRMVEGLGWRLEGTLRHGWHDGNDDLCIYGMTGDACKWLEAK